VSAEAPAVTRPSGPKNAAWYAAAWVTIVLSVLKGIRLPNRFASTHLYFNYSQGFVKRGLVGEIIHLVDAPFMYRFGFVCLVSFALLAVNVWLLWRVVRDLLDCQDAALSCFALCFTTSLALVFLSHSVGYFDHVGLAMALITIRLRSVRTKMIFLLPAGALAILIHEGTFLLFLPVAYLSVLLSSGDEEGKRARPLLVGIVLFHAALTFGVGKFGVLPGAALARMREALSQRVNFPLMDQPLDNVLAAKPLVREVHGAASVITNIDSLCIVLPALVTFIAFTLRTLNRAPWYLKGAAFAASVSPIAMHALGSDAARWDTIALVTSFLSAYLAYGWLRRSAGDLEATWWNGSLYLPLLVTVIAVNASSTTFLFNGEHVKQFPFFEHRHHLVEWLRSYPK
jgi:hypothetical protein